MPNNLEHLRGPWQATISYQGDAYDSVRTALIERGRDGVVSISVVRGSAAPDDGWMPASHSTRDVAYELEDIPLTDDGDPGVAAEARYGQAQAMAAGLNAVGGR